MSATTLCEFSLSLLSSFKKETGSTTEAVAVIGPVIFPMRGKSGYLREINARIVGESSVNLGAGRAKKGDAIDLSVGLIIPHKVGDYLTKGEPLTTIHASSREKLEDVKKQVLRAFEFSQVRVEPEPLFFGVVS